jgi:acetyl-CoA C-acetyltransferase
MSASEIVLCSPVRTAIGAYSGSLNDMPATALGVASALEMV